MSLQIEPIDCRVRWTDAKTELLRQRHVEGISYGLIAGELGFTRSATIGKAMRLGLAKRVQSQNATIRTKPHRRYRASAAAAESAQVVLTSACEPIGFWQLDDTLSEMQHCRYIVSGEGLQALYCGAQPAREDSWCPYHQRMVYRGPSLTKMQTSGNASGAERTSGDSHFTPLATAWGI